MEAVKILMRKSQESSNNPKSIEYICVKNEFGDINCYSVNDLYKILINDETIKINVKGSNSTLVPCMATNGQVYIRSKPNIHMIDDLMKLPRK